MGWNEDKDACISITLGLFWLFVSPSLSLSPVPFAPLFPVVRLDGCACMEGIGLLGAWLDWDGFIRLGWNRIG